MPEASIATIVTIDHGFAERSQHAAAESTDEAFYSDEGNAVYLV